MLPYPTAERKGENEQNCAENAGAGGYFSSFLGLPGFRLCGMSAGGMSPSAASIFSSFGLILTTEFFIEIAKLKPGIAFFRDDAFVDDFARTNLQQVFNHFSPTTSIKVI
jgi:hypothetical protein